MGGPFCVVLSGSFPKDLFWVRRRKELFRTIRPTPKPLILHLAVSMAHLPTPFPFDVGHPFLPSSRVSFSTLVSIMHVQRFIPAIVAALLALPLCHGTAQETVIPVDGYAAIVNDRIIMMSEVIAAVGPLRSKWRELYSGEELREKMNEAYLDALDTLVGRALMMEEFESREGTLPERIVSDQMNEAIRDQFNNDRVQLLKELTAMQMTFEDWREQIRENIVVSMLQREAVVDKISVSPLDIRTRYEEKVDDYKQEEQIRLRMISLHKGETEDEHRAKLTLAKSLRERAVFGENFNVLAREFSEGSKAARGGDWGWISPQNLRKEISTAAQTIEPGKVSDVIHTSDHYYLILIEARKSEGTTPLEDVHDELEAEIRREKFNELFENWIAQLRQKHYVKLYTP